MGRITTALLFCFLLVHTYAFSQFFEGNGELKYEFHGIDTAGIKQLKVSEIRVITYRSVTDTSRTIAETVLHQKFDKNGNLTFIKGCIHRESDPCAEKVDKRFYYSESGRLNAEVSYKMIRGHFFYDSVFYKYLPNGKIKVADSYFYNLTTHDDTQYNDIDFYYDSAGNLIENHLIGYSRDPYKRITYERDKNGKITKYTWLDENKKPVESGIISYDKNGMEISRQEFDDKALSCKIICRFDKSGNCVERRCYDGKSTQTLLVEYKYDGKGRLIDKYEEEPDKSLGTVTKYKYDDAGNITETEQTLANKKKLFRYVYKYDNAGNLAEEFFYDESGDLTQIYKYRYRYYR